MDLTKWNVAFFLNNESDCLNYISENYCSAPYLNTNDYHYLNSNALVRFRGMIQDMYDPEYYLEKCEIINAVTVHKYIKNGKYCDTISCKDDEVLDVESKNNVSSERRTYVVISTPGLNSWVKEMEKARYEIPRSSESHNNSSIKRPLNDTEETDVLMETDTTINKKLCRGINSETPKATLSKEHHLNFPIPGELGKACHIKVYEDNCDLKLNEVYDFLGFLSDDTHIDYANDNDDFGNKMELETHNPPLSIIPKIHCIFWKKVEYVNPIAESISLSFDRIQFLRKEIHLIFTELMMGDELAANYLLYHFLSKVYLRRDLMPLGSLTLNISNIPVNVIDQYSTKCYQILQMLLSKSHYLPMTLENMNELTFIPKKDYVCNRLTSGLLQLSEGTHLILDETKLSAGKLNESGVKAVSALANIIRNQKVPYDFNYYNMEFECDIPMLILSEGKSLLPSDSHVVLKPTDIHIRTFDEIYEAVVTLLNPMLLNDLRTYFTILKNQQYEISNNMMEIVQNDFVNMRQIQKINAEDLHQLLVLSRLICISEGKFTLDEESWKMACELESCRKARLQ